MWCLPCLDILHFCSQIQERATTLDQKPMAQRTGPVELKQQLRPVVVSICWSIGLAQPIGIITWGWDSRIGIGKVASYPDDQKANGNN